MFLLIELILMLFLILVIPSKFRDKNTTIPDEQEKADITWLRGDGFW